jgi:hypothetical protein
VSLLENSLRAILKGSDYKGGGSHLRKRVAHQSLLAALLLGCRISPPPSMAQDRESLMAQCRAWARREAEAAYPPVSSDQDIKHLTLNSPRVPDRKRQQEMENQLTATCLTQGMGPRGSQVSPPKSRRETPNVPLCASGGYWSSATERCEQIGR